MDNLIIELCFEFARLENIIFCIDELKKKYFDVNFNVKVLKI